MSIKVSASNYQVPQPRGWFPAPVGSSGGGARSLLGAFFAGSSAPRRSDIDHGEPETDDETETIADVVPLNLPTLAAPDAAEGEAEFEETLPDLVVVAETTAAAAAEISETVTEIEPVLEAEAIESDEDAETRIEFERRVDERVRMARYPHSLKRLTHAPREITRLRELDAQAAVWVPVVTFAVTAVCAMMVVILATQVADNPTRGKPADLVVGMTVLAFLGAGFATLVKSQAFFDGLRPSGRLVRTDVADAYETIRDGAAVFLDLGVVPQALGRIADLLPKAEALLDIIVDVDSRGIAVKGHPAYEQLIRMGAEVTVLTDMAEERLGRRSMRRRDRSATAERSEPHIIDESVSPYETLSDLAVMIGIALPAPREPEEPRGTRRISEPRERLVETGVYSYAARSIPKHG